ncbi:MAG: HD-GYP domain-containing protein [Granulosicoccaceae bacterium]
MATIKVDVGELRTGMYVAELDRPWLESPFLFQGFLLDNDEDIERVREVCEYVFVDPDKGDVPEPQSHEFIPPPRRSTTIIDWKTRERREVVVPFQKEIENARHVHQRTRQQIDVMFSDVRMGRNLNLDNAKAVVSDMVDSIVRNPDAMQWLTNLRKRDEYTAIHSLNVCIFALTFGRFLGLTDKELNELGIGALMHDIGKMRVPLEILNKEGKLTRDELAIVREHAMYGYEILIEHADSLPESALEVTLSHHERKDGTGYPRKLSDDFIHLFARIVAIVDVYDAITSDRVYHHGMNSLDALKHMFESRGDQFDAELIEQFIKCIGVYPIGSIVELNTGEIGIVISVAQRQRLTPIIMIVRDDQGRSVLPPRMLDLQFFAQSSENEDARGLEIRRVLEPGKCDIDLRQYVRAEIPL